jgi:hypothetical protein
VTAKGNDGPIAETHPPVSSELRRTEQVGAPDVAPPAELPHEKPHVRWRFAVLSAALAISLFGAFSPWTPSEARSGGFAIAGSIITAFAKPLEGMGP